MGIYKAGNGRMTCCYAEAGKPRPTEFVARPGSGLTLYALERVKQK
jgi:hypothetical protein